MTLSSKYLALLAVPALAVSACGGSDGDSDKDKLTSIINEGAKNPTSVCDALSADFLKTAFQGDKAACVTASKAEKGSEADIESIDITGDKATAKVKDADGENTILFTKIDGDWKVTG